MSTGHDTLDQIIWRALRAYLPAYRSWPNDQRAVEDDPVLRNATAAVRDALLAAGTLMPGSDDQPNEWINCPHLAIPLPVGVGCGNTTNEKDDPEVEHFACPCCGAPMRTATLWRCEADPELHQWIGNWDEVIEQASVGCGNAKKDTP